MEVMFAHSVSRANYSWWEEFGGKLRIYSRVFNCEKIEISVDQISIRTVALLIKEINVDNKG